MTPSMSKITTSNGNADTAPSLIKWAPASKRPNHALIGDSNPVVHSAPPQYHLRCYWGHHLAHCLSSSSTALPVANTVPAHSIMDVILAVANITTRWHRCQAWAGHSERAGFVDTGRRTQHQSAVNSSKAFRARISPRNAPAGRPPAVSSLSTDKHQQSLMQVCLHLQSRFHASRSYF